MTINISITCSSNYSTLAKANVEVDSLNLPPQAISTLVSHVVLDTLQAAENEKVKRESAPEPSEPPSAPSLA